jgi:hypothetical protein
LLFACDKLHCKQSNDTSIISLLIRGVAGEVIRFG